MVRLLNLLRPATQGAGALAIAVFMALAAHAQTLNTIYTFSHGDSGYLPGAGVTIGPNGALYGTTEHGGPLGSGVVYELVPPASPGGAWAEVLLHSFTQQDGSEYSGTGVAFGPHGALYGVTSAGSANQGVTFQLRPPTVGNTNWREVILHAFTGASGDGGRPSSTPVIGPKGVIYGAAENGGQNSEGVIYSLTPTGTAGTAWNEKILHTFDYFAGDGSQPSGTLALDAGGTIYGTTLGGGLSGFGAAFSLSPPSAAGGAWTETVIYRFGSQTGDVGQPNGLVLGPNGVLYGSTSAFPSHPPCSGNCGTVFQLSPPSTPGGPWTETVLHTFDTAVTGDGYPPISTPVIGPNGVLYGAAYEGGALGPGAIFQLTPPSSPGGTWTESILYSFTAGTQGAGPNGVTLGSDGNLYGTTYQGGVSPGGAKNQGTVFQLVLH